MSPIILAALLHAAPAQTYPNVADLEPSTQPANDMSLYGVLRLRYRQTSWRNDFPSRKEWERQRRLAPPLPTGQ